MKNKKIRISTLLITFLILSNIFSGFINIFSEGLFANYLYQTENAEFEFTTMPSKGRDVEMMERQFSHFKKNHREHQDLKLFRTFKRNPIKFWNWYSYILGDTYQYGYHEKVNSVSGKGKFGI